MPNRGRVDLISRTHGLANVAQHAVLQWRQLPAPVIAAMRGVAFGAGFQLALGADMRFVHPATRLCIMCVGMMQKARHLRPLGR
jgi:enoyl-CoA hydratase/carnithine racemase